MPRLDGLRALAARVATLWKADDSLLHAGVEGERIVAAIRLGVAACLLAIALRNVVADPPVQENYVGLGSATVATLVAGGMYLLARRGKTTRVGLVSGMTDVSLVSAALATYLVLDAPHNAVNSKVIFEVYFIAIGATCLRYDWRVCAASGALATAQYAAIVAYANAHWPLNDARFAPFPYGIFSWTAQLSRLGLLVTATILSALIVYRTRALRQLSTRDRLTGLFNRGYFDERLDQEMVRARQSGTPISVALLDVDHFKWFNDTHGHLAGDAALRAVAGVLQRSALPGEVVARYGGEEFVVLLPGTPAAAAVERLDALRRAIATLEVPLPHRGLTPGRLTASAGVASWPADGDADDEVVSEADRRLFVAKQLGRNRVVGDSPPVAAEPQLPPAPTGKAAMSAGR